MQPHLKTHWSLTVHARVSKRGTAACCFRHRKPGRSRWRSSAAAHHSSTPPNNVVAIVLVKAQVKRTVWPFGLPHAQASAIVGNTPVAVETVAIDTAGLGNTRRDNCSFDCLGPLSQSGQGSIRSDE